MPYSRTRAKSKKGRAMARRPRKGTYKGRASTRGKASIRVLKGPTAFPDKLFVKLNYSDLYTGTSTTGSVINQQFRGNSVFDPDRTGTGHQPYSLDQWAAMYGTYRVHASSIEIRMLPTNTTTIQTANWQMSVYPAANYTAGDTPIVVTELPYAKSKIGNVYDTDKMLIKHYMSTAKIFGVDKKAIGVEDNYSALISANPVDTWDWVVDFCTADQATTSTVLFQAKLTYYVSFEDRKTIAQS